MRVSSAAIFTLATLVAGNANQQALAEPSNTPHQAETPDTLVVPVTEETPARIEAISPPETVVIGQFSQKSGSVQSSGSNNSVLIGTQKEKGNSSVVLPSSSTPPLPSSPTSGDSELIVTATEVQIVGATEELQQIIRGVIKTQAGGETSQSQRQNDVAAILETGLFTNARVNTSTTPAGLNVVYEVQPVVVRSVQLSGAQALTYQIAWERLQPQIGQVISPNALKEAVQQINKWYADNGYKVARVISIRPSTEGILTLNVAEGVVNDIKFRFVNDEGKTVDDKGKLVEGRTKTDFLQQQLKLKPGQVYQESLAKQDLQQLYKTRLFETVNVAFEGDATKLDVIYEVKEIGARSVNVGGNYNADQGIVGTLTYRDQNVGGVNDTLGVNLEVGRRDFQFDSKFTSPYRETNPDRFGYSVNAFRKRGLSDTFDGDIKLANGDRVREGRVGGSFSLQRPIDEWDTSLGFNYTRVSIRDRDGKITPTDEKGNSLSLSGTGIDDLTTVSLSATKDQRDNPLNPTAGSVLKLSTEQSIPFGQGDISMNRIRANYSQFTPVKLFESKKPQVFALNLQAGTVIGDLPPYESFNLGGPDSVRGYDGGDIGSGRSYVLASAEYRFPIIQVLGGVLFADFASDLGSGDTVLGEPAGVRGKPGTGFGYGAGVRFDSPLGLIRADFGLNDQGESRLHFGIGQRF
ncbi:BamA/TamA family outer membrane protein [Mastigocladopsis repens]|uniref:BamA/TamA family outer membrane protein n=1 Tax=Mastigocladopsis repens TaxID=221287 RepID=UPI0003064C57|nr:BamA/TamA family outer membrane protein [Mastigocladopsis repens]